MPGNAEFIPADLTDRAAPGRAVAGMDGIIHLGGFSVAGLDRHPQDTPDSRSVLYFAARKKKS